MINPYAIYVNCDGAMDYNSENSGGVGFVIRFPDTVELDNISVTLGKYTGGNIERLEMEAIIQAMLSVIDVFKNNKEKLNSVKQIIFVTDRLGLSDSEKTNPYKIQTWRRNKWKNYEGKPIKNHDLLDKLDKARKKLSDQAYAKIEIEYKPRKQNKIADKLAKAGKKEVLVNESLSKKGEKIGRRKYSGAEIKYNKLIKEDKLHIHVFRKDPVQDEWEVWVELCTGLNKGSKLKIYVDDSLASKLKRRNEFIVKLKDVFSNHVRIYRTIEKPREKI